jgi:predicted DsbA family dithiol-disulfide isomerase
VRPVEVRWKLFSLEEVNKGDKTVDWENGRSAPTLRVLAMVRRQHGEDGVDRLYQALASARFEREKQLAEPGVCEAALQEAGMDPGLKAAALADPTTRDEVLAEHADVVSRDSAFGVPTLVLDDGEGPGIFGPVIRPVPEGEAAGELWDRIEWLLRQPGFFELKRGRS